jgi:hypothetical protein
VDVAFDVLGAVSRGSAMPEERDEARDLLIRTLEYREELPPALQYLLASLVREHGLFPYLTSPEDLSLADLIAYEAHRPLSFPVANIVFHAEQAEVYRRLLNGENVVLSAPTSFGKSLVVDAVLASRDFRTVVVVVPTIALIDETRRRLARLAYKYKVITHATQALASRNLIVVTQERLQEFADLPAVDFFVVDEFYKLDPETPDDRADQLNIAFRQLLGTGAQFYLLGPNISRLAVGVAETLRATFFRTDFKTVATDIRRVEASKDDLEGHFTSLVSELDGQTLVFCRSPKRTRDVARWLLGSDVATLAPQGSRLADAAEWVSSTYHPEWLVAEALRHGIGIHHGRLPRALAHHMVRLFNEGEIRVLLVTSTLIEGVNTTAQNVVVLDNNMGAPLKRYDFFTFSNILGRSGRMSKHYVGRVIVYNEAPKMDMTEVDIPVLTQPAGTSDGILIQLPWEELSDDSKDRMRPLFEQDILSLATLRANKGIRPELQLSVARQIAEDSDYWAGVLIWRNGQPTAQQLRSVAPLLFELAGSTRMGGVYTGDMLGARLNSLRFHEAELAPLISDQLSYTQGDPDEAVENVLDFMRSWAQFHVPRTLLALQSIATEVFGPNRQPPQMAFFASQLEALFQNRYVTVLEEYGLPMALTKRLQGLLGLESADSLDDVLDRLRALPPLTGLSSFEQDMLDDVKRGLGAD